MGNMVFSHWFLSIEKEEKWLNEMSKKGLRFVGKRGFFSYEFEENRMEEVYHYYVDVRPPKKNNEEYVQFLEELNIRLVEKWFCSFYFETTDERAAKYIYTDKESKSRLYIRCMFLYLTIAIFNVFVLYREFLNDGEGGTWLMKGSYLPDISIPVMLNSICLIFMVLMTMNCIRLIYRLNYTS